jgi:type III secretory pathway component EscT
LTLVLLGGDNAFGFARTIMATYAAWPIGALYPPMGSVIDFVHATVTTGAEELIRLALTLAMPIIAMITFADICVAMLARYVPQLNPLSLSLALKAMLCVLALAFAWPGLPELIARLAVTLLGVQ